MKKLLTFLAASLIVTLAAAGEAEGPRPPRREAPGPRMAPVIERLKALDANHDGVISKDEFTGPPERFQAIDTNGDGKIDAVELPALRSLAQEGRRGPEQSPRPPRARAADKPKKAAKVGAKKGELKRVESAIMLLAQRPELVRELAENPKVRAAVMQIRRMAWQSGPLQPQPQAQAHPAAPWQRMQRMGPAAGPRRGPPWLGRGLPMGAWEAGQPVGPQPAMRQPARGFTPGCACPMCGMCPASRFNDAQGDASPRRGPPQRRLPRSANPPPNASEY
jgi:hypothetical protein